MNIPPNTPQSRLGTRSLLFGIALIITSHGAIAEPHELQVLKRNFEAAQERAIKPLRDIYIRELHALVLRYTNGGNAEAASSVAEELKRHGVDTGFLGLPPGESANIPEFKDLKSIWVCQVRENYTYTLEFNSPKNVRIISTSTSTDGSKSMITGRFTAEKKDGGIAFMPDGSSRTSSYTWWEIKTAISADGELEIFRHYESRNSTTSRSYLFRKIK